MSSEDWKRKYAEEMVRVAGITMELAMECADDDLARDALEDGVDPVDAAQEELTYWAQD